MSLAPMWATRRCKWVGEQEGAGGKIVPVYRVKAWRWPNEDGAERPVLFFSCTVLWRNVQTGQRGSFVWHGIPR